jgi:hypothetical protein
MSRRRFYGMLAFLSIALVLAVTVTAFRIQNNLLSTAQNAIAEAGIPYYNVTIDGRDAVLGGMVSDEIDVARLRAVVAAVPGVSRVRDETVLERVAVAAAAPAVASGTAATSYAGAPPELRAQRMGTRIVVTGILPADGSLDRLTEALQDRFRGAELTLRVVESVGVGSRPWTTAAPVLADALSQLGDAGRVVAYGSTVQISGAVGVGKARAALDDIVAAAPEIDWRLVLTRSAGGIGGGA